MFWERPTFNYTYRKDKMLQKEKIFLKKIKKDH